MTDTSNTAMVSARLPKRLIKRVEFIIRNTPSTAVRNRTDAIAQALDAWTARQYVELSALGLQIPKD